MANRGFLWRSAEVCYISVVGLVYLVSNAAHCLTSTFSQITMLKISTLDPLKEKLKYSLNIPQKCIFKQLKNIHLGYGKGLCFFN